MYGRASVRVQFFGAACHCEGIIPCNMNGYLFKLYNCVLIEVFVTMVLAVIR